MEEKEKRERIDKLIANKFNISRQEATFLIENGKINIGKRRFFKSHSKITLSEVDKINLKDEDIEKYKLEYKEYEKLKKDGEHKNKITNNKRNLKDKDENKDKDRKSVV